MRRHELVSHVADVRLQVAGDNLEELFTAALEGMDELIKEDACPGECTLKEKIELSAIDVTALLIDFLAEVLTLSHINRSIYSSVEFASLNNTSLSATVYGCPVTSFDEDVKAVTYHEAMVSKDPDGLYACTIIFDI